MYALVRNLKCPAIAVREICTFVAAIAIAERFYTFHSFSLECLAFLLTWCAFSGVLDLGMRLFDRQARPEEQP